MGNGPSCHGDENMFLGLCYKKCRDGYSYVPGGAVLCSRSYTKNSFIIPPQTAVCPSGKKDIAGLCYVDDANMPTGYTRKVIGTLDQSGPSGSTDIGVSCQRETYNRGVGTIPLRVYLKERTKQPVDIPPPTCEEANALFSDPDKPQPCRQTVCKEDELIEGDFCVSKCRNDYTLSVTDGGKRTCTKGTDTYALRDPTPIVWGTF